MLIPVSPMRTTISNLSLPLVSELHFELHSQGKRHRNPVEVLTARVTFSRCAAYCARNYWCDGFNLIYNSDHTVLCELLEVIDLSTLLSDVTSDAYILA